MSSTPPLCSYNRRENAGQEPEALVRTRSRLIFRDLISPDRRADSAGHIGIRRTGPGTLDGFKGTATGVGTTFDNINAIAAPADLAVTKTGPATATASTVISYTSNPR